MRRWVIAVWVALLGAFVRDHPDCGHESSNTLMYAALLEKCLKSEEPR